MRILLLKHRIYGEACQLDSSNVAKACKKFQEIASHYQWFYQPKTTQWGSNRGNINTELMRSITFNKLKNKKTGLHDKKMYKVTKT